MKELLFPVHFEKIGGLDDLEEMNNLCFAYGEKGDVDFAPLGTKDFCERLAFACGNRWGLVIELVIEALTLCKMDGHKDISISYFEKAFAQKSGLSLGFSPFSVDDYREAFSEAQLLKLLLDDEE